MDRKPTGPRTGSRKATRDDSEGLFDWNLKSDRIHFSPRWLALIGCDDHEVGSQPGDWFQRVHPDDHAELVREIDDVRAGDAAGFACRYRLRHKDGTYRWMACRGTAVRDRAGRATRLTGSQSDVTVEMATDRLTGLPNRLLLIDRVTHSIERSRRHPAFHCAVLLIELGRPESLGRPPATASSDPLLTAVARRLETCLRNPGLMPSLGHNDLVARMEDDYFGILLDGLKDVAHAKVAADRILGEILNPILLAGREIRLSASIGVAVSATGYTTADEMLHDAQVAQHRARMLGGSHCEIFDTAILKSEQTELQLENDFEAALERREFVLFFQPIVALESNEVVGFEALVRWQHPVLGIVPPGDFIPLAERTGFIVPLGNWILREACRRLREWDADVPEARDVTVAVNISSVQAHDPLLVDQVAEALSDSGLEPRRLVLELTEGLAMANPAAITTLLMELRAIGVRISVDDFGTGYSSLAYLRQFPIDTLKIDRSFVRGMVTNKDTAEIVAGVLNMAQQLGLNVVAEGIEHEDQRGRLQALKCNAGQGSLFSTPVDVETAAEFLRSGLTARPDQTAAVPAARNDVTSADDTRISQLLVRARLLFARQPVSYAAAALVLLLSAGFVVVAGKVRAASSGSSPAVTDESQQRTTPAEADAPAPAPPIVPVTTGKDTPVAGPASSGAAEVVVAKRSVPSPVAIVPASPTIRVETAPKQTASPATPPPTLPSNGTPLRTAIITASPAVAPTVTARPTSLNVVHQHRLGSCRGRLEVTRDGVTFVSETDGEDEAFTLKYTEFLNALSDDTLILKSATKTYRFKSATAGSESMVQLRDLAETISRARR
jgi:PAS domain S-box-containing protein